MPNEEQPPKALAEKLRGLKGVDSRKLTRTIGWCFEWLTYWLGGLAFLKALDYLGRLGVLIAVIFWIKEIPERKQAADDARKSKHYVAWQTINSAVGKPGDAGRSDALKDLVLDQVPLDGISLAGGAAINGPLSLTNAQLKRADFSGGHFEKVNFSGSLLKFSKWDDGVYEDCIFNGTKLGWASFSNAWFISCDFSFANTNREDTFNGVNYTGTFRSSSFVGADFSDSSFSDVRFEWCNFEYANLADVKIWGTNISFTVNLFGASNASPEFVIWASRQDIIFTNVTNHDKWNSLTKDSALFPNRWFDFNFWASNQWRNFSHTNPAETWSGWSKTNLGY